jgi:Autotransporter beta-domain
MKTSPKISRLTLLLGIAIWGNQVYASSCNSSSDPLNVSSSCEGLQVNSSKTEISVNPGVSINNYFTYLPAVTIESGVSSPAFTNNGAISSGNSFVSGMLVNANTSITAFINNGSIAMSNSNIGPSYYSALELYGSIGILSNAGTIAATGIRSYGITLGGTASIGALSNLTGQSIAGAASGILMGNGATITSLTNYGFITGTAAATANPTNDGIVSNGISLFNGAALTNLINYSSISGGQYGVYNFGAITTLTNNGSISGGTVGIYNQGSIATLNNAQSGLTYSGNLPTNYNIVIKGSNQYGQASFSNVAGTPMKFGFGYGSRLTTESANYSNVLSGLSASNIANTSGTIGGGVTVVQWALTNPTGNTSTWNLGLNTPQVAVMPTVINSAAATKLGTSITQTYNLILAGAIANPTLVNGAALSTAVQTLTPSDVSQLTQVHAEGYSSNMTIGLEQMAHITNTVMDRIHAPMSASPSTKVYQDDEGRYIWADAAAVKGTVNNYNNLAGFGYNLYDLIIGGDISRSKEGGYGVFAGTGTTSMTESQQVTQNFNTTNFYAGLYGARNFDAQVKLSGALGYMYGDTNANRNTPNVGLFTGGNATSSYKTNGVYAAAKLAKAYQAESFTVSPFVGASYSQLWMGGASEQGGNDFNFAISSATAYTAVTFAGLDFVYPLLKGTNDPLSLIGFYKLGYDWYANSNSAHSITATSPTYGSFTQVGANMGPVSNMIGLGIQGGITKEISARIGAVASYNTYGHEYGGGAELRFKF